MKANRDDIKDKLRKYRLCKQNRFLTQHLEMIHGIGECPIQTVIVLRDGGEFTGLGE